MKGATAALLLSALCFVAGCAPSEAEVSGTVLVDDQPLKQGSIEFAEVDHSVTPAGGNIVDGQYKLKVRPGSKIVRILASRAPAKPDPLMGYAPLEAMIPDEFNAQSTLRADIKPGKNEGIDFKVKSIPQN